MADPTPISDTLTATLSEEAPLKISSGSVIADGVDPELDELRRLHSGGKQTILEIQERESQRTGIPSLKIGFNNVFGYYIEVRNTHKEKVPEEWIRKQTLVSAERYITPELKEYEQKILGAEERIQEIETAIFDKLTAGLVRLIPDMQSNSRAAEQTDCLLSLAIAADLYNYVRPEVNDSMTLSIKGGRHPVIERRLPAGEPYIANDVKLDCDKTQVMMITGPNMAGKSALLRQTALITLMAQIGSFVPAQAAKIGYVDKIFTRVGASDNISSGESTIAWAIVEHIHENAYCHPKTLFATHYHELNEMEKAFKRVVNYNVSVREIDGKVVFMRKLERGGSAHSFGIHVAKLAGMPPSIVKRADQVLKKLEQGDEGKADLSKVGSARDGYQLSLFQLDDPLLSQIRDRLLGINIDNLTPLQALTTLHDLQSLLTGKPN